MTCILTTEAVCDICGDSLYIEVPDGENHEEYARKYLRTQGWVTDPRDICPVCVKEGDK
jgi:hypothetical protein